MPPITRVEVSAFQIPTETPESDGTLEWTSTTLVWVEVYAGDLVGAGHTYADRATAVMIRDHLAGALIGQESMDIPRLWAKLVRAIRNHGRPGVASMAISAVDVALWDLKAKGLSVPLVSLLGAARDTVGVYGSGGFTSYSLTELEAQLGDWARAGMMWVKMKVGRDARADVERVARAKRSIGPAHLFVDANGGYSRKEALAQASHFAEQDVGWFEEPVSSDDLEGLRLLRDRAPSGMAIAAGEYGYDAHYFRRMLDAGAVDVLQADASRCGGVTGFLQVDALCHARSLGLSTHCAPSLHLQLACAAQAIVHMEYFYDHVRIEQRYVDGAIDAREGRAKPDLSRPGLGLALKKQDLAPYQLQV